MKKRFLAFLCGSVLLLPTLAGCVVAPESDTVLGEAMEQQIKEDFGQAYASDDPTDEYETAEYISENAEICSYMGIYNGYTALCIDGRRIWVTPTEWMPDPVAGYDFVHGSNSNHLVLYKDGTFIPLHDAYEQDFVSDEDIKKMYERHSGKGNAQPISDTVLGKAMEQQIKEDYILWRKSEDPKITDSVEEMMERIDIYCYMGIYGDYIAIGTRGDRLDDGTVYTDIVAGYNFKRNSGMYELWLYKDGEFTPLDEAYHRHLITEEDAKRMYERYTEQ